MSSSGGGRWKEQEKRAGTEEMAGELKGKGGAPLRIIFDRSSKTLSTIVPTNFSGFCSTDMMRGVAA